MYKVDFKGKFKTKENLKVYLDEKIITGRDGSIIEQTKDEIIIDADFTGVDKIFYSFSKGKLTISSTMSDFDSAIDQDMLDFQKKKGYVPYPFTILEGVMKAPPGLKTRIKLPPGMEAAYEPGSNLSKLKICQDFNKVDFRAKLDSLFNKILVKTKLISSFSGGFDSMLLSKKFKCDRFVHYKEEDVSILKYQDEFPGKWTIIDSSASFGPADQNTYFKAIDEPNCDSAGFAEFLMVGSLPKGAVIMNGQGADAVFCSDLVYFQVHHSLNSPIFFKIASLFPFRSSSNRMKAYSSNIKTRFMESYCAGIGPDYQKTISNMVDVYLSNLDNDDANKYAALKFMLYYPLHGMEKIRTSAKAAGIKYFLPFMNPGIVSFGFGIPAKYKVGKKFGKKILTEAYPEISALGYQSGAFLPQDLKKKLIGEDAITYEEFFIQSWLGCCK